MSKRISHPNVFLYVVRCESAIKLGVTVNLSEQFELLRSCNPFPIELELVWLASRKIAYEVESRLLGELALLQIHGKWATCAVEGVIGVFDLVPERLKAGLRFVDGSRVVDDREYAMALLNAPDIHHLPPAYPPPEGA